MGLGAEHQPLPEQPLSSGKLTPVTIATITKARNDLFSNPDGFVLNEQRSVNFKFALFLHRYAEEHMHRQFGITPPLDHKNDPRLRAFWRGAMYTHSMLRIQAGGDQLPTIAKGGDIKLFSEEMADDFNYAKDHGMFPNYLGDIARKRIGELAPTTDPYISEELLLRSGSESDYQESFLVGAMAVYFPLVKLWTARSKKASSLTTQQADAVIKAWEQNPGHAGLAGLDEMFGFYVLPNTPPATEADEPPTPLAYRLGREAEEYLRRRGQ